MADEGARLSLGVRGSVGAGRAGVAERRRWAAGQERSQRCVREPPPHIPPRARTPLGPTSGERRRRQGGASRGVDVAPRDPARARPLSTPCRARTAQACRARPSPHRRRPSGGARRDLECFSHAAPRVPAPGAPAWSWVPQAEPPVGSRAGDRLRVYIQVRPTRTEGSCPPRAPASQGCGSRWTPPWPEPAATPV